MSSSLDGIRVLDLSRLAAGNMISHMLADHGADVIKVERPEKGDDLRTWKVNNISHWWHVYSRNKRSLSLNIKTKQGTEILKKLISTADVFIENFASARTHLYQKTCLNFCFLSSCFWFAFSK